MAKQISALIFVFILISSGFYLLSRDYFLDYFLIEKTGIFRIEKGQNLKDISYNLKKEGYFSHPSLFSLLVIFSGKKNQLQAGSYFLKKNDSVFALISKFSNGEVFKIKITLPEGLTLKEIEKVINDKLLEWRNEEINLEQFKIGEFQKDYSFLATAPSSHNLEGFLFPDTYYFTLDINSQEIADLMLKNFGRKFNLKLQTETERQKKTIYEIVIMASLLEEEAKTYFEKQKIADILWRRLEIGMPLQVDATINYITGEKKLKLTEVDLQIDSPYNTYKYQGLPPGPISNPGLESLKAALFPLKNDYWYYLSTPEGRIIFSKTFDEHRQNKLKYLKYLK